MRTFAFGASEAGDAGCSPTTARHAEPARTSTPVQAPCRRRRERRPSPNTPQTLKAVRVGEAHPRGITARQVWFRRASVRCALGGAAEQRDHARSLLDPEDVGVEHEIVVRRRFLIDAVET